MDSNGLEVLHVIEACGGGVRRHLRLIVPALVERGIRCGVFAFGNRYERDFGDDLAMYRSLGVPVWSFPTRSGMLRGIPRGLFALRRVLRSENPRTMHLHASVAGLVGRLAACALPHVNVVYSPHAFAIHPTMPLWIRSSIRIVERLGAHRTKAYAFVGRAEIGDANRLQLPPEKFNLIENGLPADYRKHLLSREEARARLELAPDDLVAVVPCRLAPQKGLPQLLAAVARTQGVAQNMQVIFCGDGPEAKALMQLANSLHLTDRVHFRGAVPELATLLKAFDLAVLPSLYEGLSYVLLECLAAGVPLVVSDILANVPRPEIRECLQTFYVGDVDGLAAELERTVERKEWAAERAARGMKLMEHDFRLDMQVDKLTALYKRLY